MREGGGRPEGRQPLCLFQEKQNDGRRTHGESSYIIGKKGKGKERTFGYRKKFRKMVKNLLTGEANRAIMYKLA